MTQMGTDNRPKAPTPIICGAIHGILTEQTRASWPDEFDAFCMAQKGARAIHVIKKEYAAGPFPRLNWFKNRRLAAGLVAEIKVMIERLLARSEDFRDPFPEIWLVAHSNGAVIALDVMRRLVSEGFAVAGIFLTGAACESDVARNGVLEAFNAGMLTRAVSWSSPDDGVVNCSGLWGWLKWPYGDLGKSGWQKDGKKFQTWEIYTLWKRGGHGVYFRSDHIEETFRMFVRSMMEVERARQRAREGTEGKA